MATDKNGKVLFEGINEEYLKEQNFKINYPTFIGNLDLSYLDQNTKINNIISKDIETLNYSFYRNFKFGKTVCYF